MIIQSWPPKTQKNTVLLQYPSVVYMDYLRPYQYQDYSRKKRMVIKFGGGGGGGGGELEKIINYKEPEPVATFSTRWEAHTHLPIGGQKVVIFIWFELRTPSAPSVGLHPSMPAPCYWLKFFHKDYPFLWGVVEYQFPDYNFSAYQDISLKMKMLCILNCILCLKYDPSHERMILHSSE